MVFSSRYNINSTIPFPAEGIAAIGEVNLANEIAITPDIQYIKNPANNPDVNSTFVFSLRIRAAF